MKRRSAHSSKSKAASRASGTWPTALARQPDDFVTDSYRGLYVKHCEQHGLPLADMLFEEP